MLNGGEIVEVGTVAELRGREGGVSRGMLKGKDGGGDDKGKKIVK